MASEGAKNFRPKPYSERGRRNERQRSFLGIVTDTVKGLFQSSWLEQPIQTNTDTSTLQEEKRNHIQPQPGNSTTSVESNLGQSYIQPSGPPALPGPSKLLPQMPVGLSASSGVASPLTRLDRQGPGHRQDPLPFSSDLAFGQFDDKSTSLIVNGGDDRSEFSDCSVSTSGCSSMAGNQDKEFQQESSHLPKSHLQKPDFISSRSHKRAESSFLWSGSVNRPSNKSSVLQNRSEISSRNKGPSFNISVFGSPLSKSAALRSSHSDSHFYPGKTVFGGASSQKKRKLHEISPQLTPSKRQVHAKPVSSSISGVTSTSARRILSVLERMSSPLQDAKKIPSYNSSLADSPLSFTPSSVASAANRRGVLYRRSSSSLLKGPPVHAVITPGRVHVAKNYHHTLTSAETHSQQDSTRTDATKSSSQQSSSTTITTTQSYSDYSAGSGSRPGKVKQPRSQHYTSRKDESDVVIKPDLPTDFTLPVSNVPKFNFGPTTSSSQQSSVSHTKSIVSEGTYTFSSPIPQSEPDVASSCSAQNFQFSSPITMDALPSSSTPQKTTVCPSSVEQKTNMSQSRPDLSFKFNPTAAKSKPSSGNSELKKVATPSAEGLFKPAGELKTGSVMDVLGQKTSAADTANTQSSAASLTVEHNDEEKKKAASSSRLNGRDAGSTEKPSLSELFKKPSNMWECPTCMIQNKDDCSKCVACETSKPGASTSMTKPVAAEPVPSIPVDKSLAEKFKKPEGSWECDTCMVNNTSTAAKCIACETPKPGEKKPTSFITAGGFHVESKTAASTSSPFASAGFGQRPSQDETGGAATSGGFTFGASLDSKKNSLSTRVDDGLKSEGSKPGGFKFGQSLGNSSIGTVNHATGGFAFGHSDSSKVTSGFSGNFSFGSSAPAGDSKKEESSTVGKGLMFGQASSGNANISENKMQEPSVSSALSTTSAEQSSSKSNPAIKTDNSTAELFQSGTGNKPVDVSAKETQADSKFTSSEPAFSMPASLAVPAANSGVVARSSEGVTNLSSADAKPTFSFGSSDKKESSAPSTTAGFTFGQTVNPPKSTVLGVPQQTESKTAAVITKADDAKPANPTQFIFSQSTQSSSNTTFGALSGQAAGSTGFGIQTGQPSISTGFAAQSVQPAGGPGFGTQPTQTAAGPGFGGHAAQPAVNTGFGAQTAGVTGFGSQPVMTAGGTGFGAQTVTSTAAPSFAFGVTHASTNGPSATSSFSFSDKPSDKPAVVTTTSSVFNLTPGTSISSTSATPDTKRFTFSGKNQESPMSAVPTLTSVSVFQFGQGAAPTDSPFNKPASSTKTTTSTLIFGPPTSTAPAVAGFGQQTAAASAFGGFPKSASTPTFGSTVKSASEGGLGSNVTPAFGSSTPAFGSGVATPAFGSTVNPPAFGAAAQMTKSAAVFGSGTPTPSFQFGSQQPATGATLPSSGVFQFGQTPQPAASPNAGFNFSANPSNPAAANAVPPTFGGSTPVNTNFTGLANPTASTFQFNATPTAGSNNPFSLTSSSSARRVKTARRKLPRK